MIVVRDTEDQQSSALVSTELSNQLVFYKSSFDACQSKGPLMVYICKLFSVHGTDIVGMPESKKSE